MRSGHNQIKCKICGGSAQKNHELQDYRLKISGRCRFFECVGCGYGFLDPMPSPETLKKMYEKYYPRSNSLPRQKKIIWFRYIANRLINSDNPIYLVKENRGRLLDIGCACGDALFFFQEMGFECYGIEIDSRAASFCKEKGLRVYQSTTLDKLDYPDDYFDVIILAQVIEHIGSIDTLLTEINRILRPKGKVYITTPNFSSYLRSIFKNFWVSGWFLPFHLHLYSEDSIKRLTGKFGFSIREIYAKTPAPWFLLCIKSFLYKEKEYAIEGKSNIVDSILFQLIIAPFLKFIDMITGRGDCLFVIIEKKEDGH